MTERYRVKLHPYMLIPNHLVLATPDANLNAAMQWLKTDLIPHERRGIFDVSKN